MVDIEPQRQDEKSDECLVCLPVKMMSMDDSM